MNWVADLIVVAAGVLLGLVAFGVMLFLTFLIFIGA